MFNQSQKMQFIKSYTEKNSTRELAYRCFNSIEDLEIERGADFCTFDTETICKVFDQSIGVRGKSLSRFFVFKHYIEWCAENNIPGANTEKIDYVPQPYEKDKIRMVFSPAHLKVELDKYLFDDKLNTTDIVLKTYCWLAYSGVDEYDSILIRESDIDFNDMVIRYNGKEYILYRESLQTFRKCATLRAFKVASDNYLDVDKGPSKQRGDGDILLRTTQSYKELATIRSSFSRKNKNAIRNNLTNVKLSYQRIALSGTFYRIYELEVAGIKPDFYELAGEFMKGKEYTITTVSLASKRKELAKHYESDYKIWKEAFIVK